MNDLRSRLVAVALEWESSFVNAPAVTTAVSEYDAARLVGLTESEYAESMRGSTTVQRGFDFKHSGVRYQVKGTRASGKPGSKITKVPGVTNYDWDKLIWVSYDPNFEIQEAWLWEVEPYRAMFHTATRISPEQMRRGQALLTK